jgi:hypothetical protein
MSVQTPAVHSIEKRRHDWLSARTRWASVKTDFDRNGVYARHRVVWHVPGEWLSAEGQSFEEAVDNAMKHDALREVDPA